MGTTIKELKDILPEYNPIKKLTFSCFGEPSFGKK